MADSKKTRVDIQIPGLDEKVEELRRLIRQGNELLRDMKTERKAAEKLVEEMKGSFAQKIEQEMDKAVRETLDAWGEVTTKAIAESEKRINKRYDQLADIMLGEARGDNRESLGALIRKWKENNPDVR